MSGEDQPQLHVTHPISPGELAGLGGRATHPVSAPVPLPVSYSILIHPPEGGLIAFSDDEHHTPERYHQARFFLGPGNRGTFTFMPSATQVSIEGTGTVDATEERVSFEATGRDLSGTFSFPRNGPHGEVALVDGSVHLKARAVRGI